MREELDKADRKMTSQKRDVMNSIEKKLRAQGYRLMQTSSGSTNRVCTYESKNSLDIALIIDHYDYEANHHGVEVKSTIPGFTEQFEHEVNFIRPYVDAYLQKLSEFQTYKELAGQE